MIMLRKSGFHHVIIRLEEQICYLEHRVLVLLSI